MKRIMKYTLSAVLSSLVVCGCGNDSFDMPDYYTRVAKTDFGQEIVDGSGDYITHVKNDTETEVMDGVTLLEMGYLNTASHAMQLYAYKVELGDALVSICIPDDNTKIEKVQKLTDQAMAIENKGNFLVMGGISGGAFTAGTGAPSGILFHNSKAYKADMGKDAAFFGITKDGEAVCLEASEFEAKKSRLKEAVSGSAMILKDGYVLPETNAKAEAKAAIGVDKLGGTVYMVVADGGNYFYSNGISNSDMAYILRGCGAANAIILNSGANVSAFVRDEDSLDIFKVVNTPSNHSVEAEIGNGIVILQL